MQFGANTDRLLARSRKPAPTEEGAGQQPISNDLTTSLRLDPHLFVSFQFLSLAYIFGRSRLFNLSDSVAGESVGSTRLAQAKGFFYLKGNDMRITHSFVARVRELAVAGNPGNEFAKIVALKQGDMEAFLVMRRMPKAEDVPRKSSAAIAKYPVSNCVKITPWRSVEKTGNMAVHFEKRENSDLESTEVRIARLAGKLGNSRNANRTGRTKIITFSLRRWSLEDADDVKAIWEVLNEAVVQKQLLQPPERLKVSSDRVTFRGSVVDEKTRMKERRRYIEDHRVLPNVPRSSLGGLSQGEKMMKAMSMGSQQKHGRYSALTRGATGRRSFSDSLIGSPDLKDFDKKLAKPQRDTNVENHLIAKELSNRSQQPAFKATSVFSPTPQPVDIDDHSTSPQILRKRRRDKTTSEEVAVKRKKHLSQQLKNHKASSQTAQPRRMLRSTLQSLPRSSSSEAVTASGIVNEGNTCYLSAVVQALMSDKDLIARIVKRIELGSSSMPFSAALTTMAKGRESSTALNAGLIRQAISKYFPQFSSSQQQDAHEFLLRCLDVFAKECSLSDFRDSPTHTNYSLVQERKFTCISCGHQTKPRREILRGLSLDIPHEAEQSIDGPEQSPPLSVQDLIGSFFAPQELNLDCESCNGKNAKSDTKIVLAPRTLVLHIKRFGVNYESENGAVSIKKISDRVSIPERIALDSALTENACSPDVIESQPKMDAFDMKCPRNVTPTGIEESEKLFSLPSSPVAGISFPPSKTQAPSHLPELPLPPDTNVTNRPCAKGEPFNFTRRFRVHADEPKNNQHTDSADSIILERPGSTCRNVKIDDDDIEDDNDASQAPSPLDRQPESKEHVKAIIGLGIPEREAKKFLQEANHDVTRAMGMAMDRRQQLSENPTDLNDDLLNCIARIEKARVSSVRTKLARYKLAAVIRHHSDTTEKGHYVADVLQPDGSWFCYNDSSVFKISSTDLQDREGYLCWYITA